tara:strand:+ start:5858 stop:6037 length:180 start_codon:yes stop_codon:yes gene_type:complete
MAALHIDNRDASGIKIDDAGEKITGVANRPDRRTPSKTPSKNGENTQTGQLTATGHSFN